MTHIIPLSFRQTQSMLLICLAMLNAGMVPYSLASDGISPGENELLTTENFLDQEEVSFDDSGLTQQQNHWWSDLKTTLQHRYAMQPGDTFIQQSSVRLEYERAIAQRWYFRVDNQYRYFWPNDDLAERRGRDYGHNKWQELWLQYSKGACAYKAGRQLLIWGEVEGTFAVDIVTPFDFTEQLLTDYGNIRLAQDMLFSECFLDQVQTQLFFVPDARTDTLYHSENQLAGIDQSVTTGKEWGGRLKLNWQGGDLSVMAARLRGNQAVPVPSTTGLRSEIADFELLGVSSSIAIRRLLLKMDLGYKTDQLIALSEQTTDRLDIAFGFEYITSTNHNLNGGLWATHFLDGATAPDSTQVLTAGWSKTLLNDDLAVSLLANWLIDPRTVSATLLAEYQWDDFWNFAGALGFSESEESNASSPFIQPDKLLTLAVKYEF